MDITRNLANAQSDSVANIAGIPPRALSRRSFMRYITMGAAAVTVQGCGGGGGGSETTSPVAAAPVPTPVAPAPAPAPGVLPSAPVWLGVPEITFTQGVASSISVASFISAADAAAVKLSLNTAPLPAGVSFNATERSFDYDGQGAVNSTEGHVLTATVG